MIANVVHEAKDLFSLASKKYQKYGSKIMLRM